MGICGSEIIREMMFLLTSKTQAYAKGEEYLNANKGRYDCGGWAYIGSPGTQDVAEFWSKPAKGKIKIVKTSMDPAITNGNSCYSLQGAIYGIYQNGNEVGRLTTKADGTTDEISLSVGNYTIKELSAPKGYALDKTSYAATVSSNKTATVNVKDIPTNDPIGIEIEKVDSDGQKVQGSASLAGAEFTIKYYDGFYDAKIIYLHRQQEHGCYRPKIYMVITMFV